MDTFKINDIFYSLQGEGFWVGHPMGFIRLAGCNLNCIWCDTKHEQYYPLNAEEICAVLQKQGLRSDRVVLTGGEPLMQDIEGLIFFLQSKGLEVHLETNGTYDIPENVEWVTVSPKKELHPSTLKKADEVKLLFGHPFFESQVRTVQESPGINPLQYIMPLEVNNKEVDAKTILEAIKFCLKNPQWALSPRLHIACSFK